jgi:hypothetical protein
MKERHGRLQLGPSIFSRIIPNYWASLAPTAYGEHPYALPNGSALGTRASPT